MSKVTNYTVHLDVNVSGWEEGIDVEVDAESQWHACDLLGEVLTDLCRKHVKRTAKKAKAA